jgi:hypothetical protein
VKIQTQSGLSHWWERENAGSGKRGVPISLKNFLKNHSSCNILDFLDMLRGAGIL